MGGGEVVGVDAPSKEDEDGGEVDQPITNSSAASTSVPNTSVPNTTITSASPLPPAEEFELPEWAKSVFKNTHGKTMPCLTKWRGKLPAYMAKSPLARLSQGLCIKQLVEGRTIHYHRNNGIIVASQNGMVLAACANFQCRLTTKAAKGMQLVNKYSDYITKGDGGAGTFTFDYDPGCITWLRLTKNVFESVKAKDKGMLLATASVML